MTENTPFIELIEYETVTKKDKSKSWSTAIMKAFIGGVKKMTAAEGIGPVYALETALQKIVKPYTFLDDVNLIDYKVKIKNGDKGSASRVEVAIQFENKNKKWICIGISDDVIEASWFALIKNLEYMIICQERTMETE